MAQLWEQNEEIDENEELVVTEHRDESEPAVPPEEEPSTETDVDDPQEALDELGEDVSSSPARRGRSGTEPRE